jgi:hypothetical protein
LKRLKLKNFVAGQGNRQFLVEALSGATPSGLNVNLGMFTMFGGVTGDVLTDPGEAASDGVLYDSNWFTREYSVNHDDYTPNGRDLQYRAPDAPILDMVQFGNYTFNLSDLSISGVSYAKQVYREWDSQRVWKTDPHQICTYVPGSSACIPDVIIEKTSFSIGNVYVFADMVDGEMYVFVKNLSSTVSDITNNPYETLNCFKLPFNYLMEEPLKYNPHFIHDLYGDWDDSEGAYLVFGENLDSVSLSAMYCPEGNRENRVYMNPTMAKNMYNYNFNVEVQRDALTGVATGWRDYFGIGGTQHTLWLKYNYWRETEDGFEKYDLAERVRGLFKFKPADTHKSNIFSVRINNSGLNMIADLGLRGKIQTIVEETLLDIMKKITPAHTQLWKVEWTGGFKADPDVNHLYVKCGT